MARRPFHIFSMSFLDIISCGFGAVVLFFVIINAQVRLRADAERIDLLSETTRLEDEVLEGRKDLLQIRGERDELEDRRARAAEELRRLRERLAALLAELAEYERLGTRSQESAEKLRADVERLRNMQQELEARIAESEEGAGQQIRQFEGAGSRQYLTGMRMDGDRVLILVDASASMLGRTYAAAVNFRVRSKAVRSRASKWRQVADSVDWITTRLEPQQRFQIYIYGEDYRSILAGSDGQWLSVADGARVGEAVEALRDHAPQGGTSMHAAVRAVRSLEPLPDNVYLLTDGLPTQGASPPPRVVKVDQRARSRHFERAVRDLPSGIPINVLFYPLDGDPAATGYYWMMASRSRGSFVSVSRDWP
ncbi:MAG: VWA domain-containing protein [Gammaproteobacteria bacterium]|nr:VWA domain-containing protein [Gammaproteobacteria bacterium]